jgi:hypothetical protein
MALTTYARRAMRSIRTELSHDCPSTFALNECLGIRNRPSQWRMRGKFGCETQETSHPRSADSTKIRPARSATKSTDIDGVAEDAACECERPGCGPGPTPKKGCLCPCSLQPLTNAVDPQGPSRLDHWTRYCPGSRCRFPSSVYAPPTLPCSRWSWRHLVFGGTMPLRQRLMNGCGKRRSLLSLRVRGLQPRSNGVVNTLRPTTEIADAGLTYDEVVGRGTPAASPGAG